MKLQSLKKIRQYCQKKLKVSEDITARSVLEYVEADTSELLTNAELKEKARQVIDEANDMTVTSVSRSLHLSRQRVYQALSTEEDFIDTGLDICQKILIFGGYTIERANITLVRLKD